MRISTLLVPFVALQFSVSAFAQDARAKGPLPIEELRAMASVFSLLQSDHVTPVDPKQLLRQAIQGMVRGADPDGGEYYSPQEFADLKGGSKRDEAAVGIEMWRRDGQLVLAPVRGGPASEAGVRPGDVLHAVDQTRTLGLGTQQVAELLRGAEGTRVSLTVFRDSSLSIETISVERRSFSLPKPSLARLPSGAVALQISAFQEHTLGASVAALREAWQAKPFKAVVLDLRGCPGGLVEASVGVAAMFLPQGATVAVSDGPTATARQVFRALPETYATRQSHDPLADLPDSVRALPMAVLVDSGTSAGAEIVAAALQDHKRALVVGRRTFGRGSIQTILPLGNSDAVKFTTAYWTSPSGSRIHGSGVTPDLELSNTAGAEVLEIAAQRILFN